jgi:hypothetical protein
MALKAAFWGWKMPPHVTITQLKSKGFRLNNLVTTGVLPTYSLFKKENSSVN